MTREEAIARIKNHKIVHKMSEPRAIYISEALDMAIKALEVEPCAEGDAISREDAIEACLNGWNKDYKEIIKDIKQLPSVQPLPQCTSGYLYSYITPDEYKVELVTEQEPKQEDYSTEILSTEEIFGLMEALHEREPKTGHWEETRYRSYDPQSCETYDDGVGFRCSNCANVFKVTSLARYHYCPNCGAKMGVEE